MDDLELVAVLYPRYKLLKESPSPGLWHPPIGDDVIKELATSVLEDDDNIGRGRDNFVAAKS